MEFSTKLHTIKSGWSIVYIEAFPNNNAFLFLKIDFVLANSANPDEITHYASRKDFISLLTIPSYSIDGHKCKIFDWMSLWIEMLWDCGDNVRETVYIEFLLSLSDILYVTFLASTCNEVNYIWRSANKMISATETSRHGCAQERIWF